MQKFIVARYWREGRGSFRLFKKTFIVEVFRIISLGKSLKLSFIALNVLFAGGCGVSTTVEQILNIEMYGTNASPSNAQGEFDPLWQEYVLTSVVFVDENTNQVVVYNGGSSQKVRIVNRSQIIYTKDIETYNGTTFSSCSIAFNPQITGAYGDKEDYTFTLTTPTLTLDDSFTVETGKGLNMYIKIKWKNTVTETQMYEPEYVLSVESS